MIEGAERSLRQLSGDGWRSAGRPYCCRENSFIGLNMVGRYCVIEDNANHCFRATNHYYHKYTSLHFNFLFLSSILEFSRFRYFSFGPESGLEPSRTIYDFCSILCYSTCYSKWRKRNCGLFEIPVPSPEINRPSCDPKKSLSIFRTQKVCFRKPPAIPGP